MRILITAHIDGQLEAVGVKVAEIVETCQANQITLSPNSAPRGRRETGRMFKNGTQKTSFEQGGVRYLL